MINAQDRASQGTTPCYILTIPDDCGIDFTQVGEIYATLEQGRVKLTKSGDGIADVLAHSVYMELTQEESLRFNPGSITVQLNWTYPSGRRGATKTASIPFAYNTERRVLE